MSNRKKINLNTLPAWQQYLIGIVVIAIVVAAAWIVGKDDPVPAWITNCLIPLLSVLGVILIVLAVGEWLKRWRRNEEPPGEE